MADEASAQATGGDPEQPAVDPPDAASPLHDLGSYIRHQREGARLSLRHLAKIAGVSNPYLSQIERGLRKPSAEILQAIAKALEISSETLYVKAGILEEREPSEDLEAAIARDPHLTAEQRQLLGEMYRSFRQLTELRGAPAQPPSRLRGLLDAVGTGTVDDEAIRAATPARSPRTPPDAVPDWQRPGLARRPDPVTAGHRPGGRRSVPSRIPTRGPRWRRRLRGVRSPRTRP